MNELEEYFRKLRFDENFHLGLGDVRLTIAMQEEVVAIAKRVASQQSVQSDGACAHDNVNPISGVCYGCHSVVAFSPRR